MDTATALQLLEGLDIVVARWTPPKATSPRWPVSTGAPRWQGGRICSTPLLVTFGYKAAVWLSAFDRHAERLEEILRRLLVVPAAIAEVLDLRHPAITWHPIRHTPPKSSSSSPTSPRAC
ncbi:hypothetical protein [Aurantimonas sp. 22II-16-19i]|uniref:hypothetical protein n=1 Tax=Aurantimonas sp. 22II-16-19i TaxID=1317114 RepID=UPI0009F7C420|nr:hypothetical protein [Aurantimonas sp. 22II-16-19i]ORE93248.1 fumarate lyase [Aurantimonas sp. 22II-16-19i]